MTKSMNGQLTEAALFELLSLECHVDSKGTVHFYNALGQLHREYGPAVEYKDGGRAWCQNGQRHRVDGPAVEGVDGYRAWWQNDQLHRLDGPAIEYSDGGREWHRNGQRHRVDGPAVEYADYRAWYINGEELTEDEWQRAVASMERV